MNLAVDVYTTAVAFTLLVMTLAQCFLLAAVPEAAKVSKGLASAYKWMIVGLGFAMFVQVGLLAYTFYFVLDVA